MLLSIEDYDIFTLVSRVNKWVNTLHNSYHIHSLSQEECVGEEVNKDSSFIVADECYKNEKSDKNFNLSSNNHAYSSKASPQTYDKMKDVINNNNNTNKGIDKIPHHKNRDSVSDKAYHVLLQSNKQVYKSSQRFQQVAYAGGKNSGANGYNTIAKKISASDFVDTKPKSTYSSQIDCITQDCGAGHNLDMEVPNEKNTMFWCFYNLLYGATPKAYEFLENTCKTELETKFLLVEVIRSNKESVKSLKISKSSIEENIVHDELMNIRSVIALVHSTKSMNLLYICGRAYHEIILDDDLPFHIIKRHPDKEKYGYRSNVPVEAVKYIRDSLWHMENMDKPMRCISYYKADDLRHICTQLQLTFSNNEKSTKPVMYEKIVKYLSAT